MSCTAGLAASLWLAAAAPDPCVTGDLDLAVRYGQTLPDVGVSRQLSLPRARATFGVQAGQGVGGRLAAEAVRSGGESGAIGIDGESIVARLAVAELAYAAGDLRLEAGLVEDPWVVSGDAAWGLRPVAPGLAQDQGWLSPADLGATVSWGRPALRLSLSGLAGEGATRRERNDLVDGALLLSFRPLQDKTLQLDVLGRVGAEGLDLTRRHRLGVRVAGRLGPVRPGAEAMLALGTEHGADQAPLGLSAWARTDGEALGWLRADYSQLAPGAAGGVLTLRGGGGLRLGPQAFALGLSFSAVGEDASALPGAAALADELQIFVQWQARLSADAPLGRAPDER